LKRIYTLAYFASHSQPASSLHLLPYRFSVSVFTPKRQAQTITQDHILVILSSNWHCQQILLDNFNLFGYYAKYENG